VTGILFALLGNTFFSWWDVPSWVMTIFLLVSGAILVLIFLYDLETMEIPNILLWIGVGWALPMLLLLDAYEFNPGISVWSLHLHSGILAGLVAFLPLFLMAAISCEKWMGMGDGFLAFFLGLIVGWPHILFALVSAFGMGALTGIVLILLKKKELQSQIPLGPFLIIGAFLALLLPEWFPGMLGMFFWY
jgi:prepilin signal peptidase PulO-like enzyme (type II secretory pathway)